MRELVLRPSRLRAALLVLVSALFTAIGAWMIACAEPKGWLVAGFFGACLCVLFVNALPSASHLRLDASGFEVRSLFRSKTYLWSEIESFGVARIGGTVTVVFTRRSTGASPPPMRFRLSRADGALPDRYGRSAEDLAVLLEAWRTGNRRGLDAVPDDRDVRRATSSLGDGPGALLVLKLASLLSFCGGPLVLGDLFDAKHKGPLAFVIVFSPIALLVFGALSLGDDADDAWARWCVRSGLFGAVLLTAMNAAAVVKLATESPQVGKRLAALGIVVGLATAAAYSLKAIRFLSNGTRLKG